MKKILCDLEQIYFENNKKQDTFYRPGVELESIKDIEQMIGNQFNDELKTLYQYFDGNQSDVMAMIEGCRFLSLNEVVNQWNEFKELMQNEDFGDIEVDVEDGIQPVWIDEKWVPVFAGGECAILVDLNPTKEGKLGQVLMKYHDEEAYLIADSVSELLSQLSYDPELGYFTLDEDSDYMGHGDFWGGGLTWSDVFVDSRNHEELFKKGKFPIKMRVTVLGLLNEGSDYFDMACDPVPPEYQIFIKKELLNIQDFKTAKNEMGLIEITTESGELEVEITVDKMVNHNVVSNGLDNYFEVTDISFC